MGHRGTHSWRGEVFTCTGRNLCHDATSAAAKAIELGPQLADAHLALADIRQSVEWDWRGTEQEYRRAVELNANLAGAHDGLAFFLDKGYLPDVAVVYLYGTAGNRERAFTWLERAYRERDAELANLKVSAHFDCIRSDPRFGEYVRKMGLPQ